VGLYLGNMPFKDPSLVIPSLTNSDALPRNPGAPHTLIATAKDETSKDLLAFLKE